MAKRARPAQGANSLHPKKMPTKVKFSTYGVGATPHAKPKAAGATMPEQVTRPIKRGGPRGGKRAPRDPGVRITPLS
jgi:hypothetical protein